MDKSALLRNLTDILDEELKNLILQYETTKFNSIDAPHRMESRYDTSGIEASWLADGLSKNIQGKRKLITQISGFKLKDVIISDKVVPGCIVEVTTEDVKKYYFLLPFNSGGYTLNQGGKDIVVLGLATPLAKKLLFKQKGAKIVAGEDNEPAIISDII